MSTFGICEKHLAVSDIVRINEMVYQATLVTTPRNRETDVQYGRSVQVIRRPSGVFSKLHIDTSAESTTKPCEASPRTISCPPGCEHYAHLMQEPL